MKKKYSPMLLKLWVVSWCVAMIVSAVYVHGFAPDDCLPPVTVPWQAQLVGMCFILAYCYPLLFAVLHFAKREEMQKIIKVVVPLILFFSFFLIVYFYFLITDPINLLW